MTINHKDIAVGVEAANGFVKGLSSISESGQVDTYLNTLTESTEEEYNQFKNGISQTEVYHINGEYYKVGLQMEKGLNQSYFATRNDLKYEDPLWQTSFILAVYRQIKDAPSLTVSKVFVATGLPVNDDQKGSIKKKLKEAFVDKVHSVNGQKFSIDGLFFIGQGSASFYNDLFIVSEDGTMQPNKKFFAETAPINKNSLSKIMYVDLGFSTLDYRLVKDYTISKESLEDDGMKVIWNRILDRVKAEEENEWLVGVDVLQVEDQIREGKKILLNFQEADISKVFNEEMMKYARRVIKQLYIGEFDNMVYEQIRFVGGGSIPLKPFLEKAIAEYHKGNQGRMDAYKFVEDPQTTNCRGYLKFAQANITKLRQQEAVTK